MVVGALGTVLSTDDGGATWTAQFTQGSVTLFDVFFTDPSNGRVVGNADALFQTSDGVAHWTDRTMPCGKICTKLIDLLKVRFTSPQSGWIVGERGMVYRTADGGFSWSEGKSLTTVSLFGLTFPDPSHGWASGEQGAIFSITTQKAVTEIGKDNSLFPIKQSRPAELLPQFPQSMLQDCDRRHGRCLCPQNL